MPITTQAPVTTASSRTSQSDSLTYSTLSDESDWLLDFPKFKMSPTGMALVSWIKGRYQRCKSDRLSIQRQWDLNLEMFAGRQWLEWMGSDPNRATLQNPPSPRHRVKATVNLIRPAVRMEISRQTSQQPTAYVIPSSTNDSAISAARGGEMVWKSIVERCSFQNRVMNDVAFWNSITGNGFIKEVWNGNKSDPSNVMEDGTTQAMGDIDIGSVRPYNLFFPDLLAKDIEDQPYAFEAYTKPIEWVKHFFKGKITNPMSPDNQARQDILGSRAFDTTNNTEALPDQILVIECYIKPGGCELFPEGGMVTLVGDELAQVVRKYPFSHGEFPYAHIRLIPSGKFYGDSILIDLNPLQREYNGTISQIMEWKRKAANPALLVPKGAMPIHKITAEPGQILEYLPGLGKPEPLQLQAIPSFVTQEPGRIKADMEDISAQHAPSKGQAPGSGVTAATAIAFLQERDDSMMSPTYDSIEAGVGKIARHSLIDVQERWDLPRLVRTTGLDGAVDALALKGSQISTDIKVEPGSALPESRSARQATLMELAQMQMIDPPTLLELLEIGGIKKLTEMTKVDRDQARRENIRMKEMQPEEIDGYNKQQQQAAQMGQQEQAPNGQPVFTDELDPATFPPIVDVHDYDNHEVHVKEHNNYRKSAEFEALDNIVKDEFNRHVRMHQAYLQSNMQEIQQAQMTGEMPQGGMPMPDGSSMPPSMEGGAAPQTPEEGQAPPEQEGGLF